MVVESYVAVYEVRPRWRDVCVRSLYILQYLRSCMVHKALQRKLFEITEEYEQ